MEFKMARQSKAEKAMASIMAMLAEAGVDTSEMAQPVRETDYRPNDAAVIFSDTPSHFKPKLCLNCKRPFGVNKASVGYCSDICRREAWTRNTGMPWAAVSIHDVWYGDPPMIITPVQFEKLKKIADWFMQAESQIQVEATPVEEDDLEDSEVHQTEPLFLPPAEFDSVSAASHTSPVPSPNQSTFGQMFAEAKPFVLP